MNRVFAEAGHSARNDGPASVFFALWPDEGCAGRLHAIAERLALRFAGRAMAKETLHLTLAFVGNVNPGRLPELLDLGREVAAEIRSLAPAAPESGLILLDRLGCWPRKRILWMGSDHPPSTPGVLAELLAVKLRARGYALPLRSFAPHVTLVRKPKIIPAASALDALKFPALGWPYDSFVLVRSRPSSSGAAYERLGSWALAEALP